MFSDNLRPNKIWCLIFTNIYFGIQMTMNKNLLIVFKKKRKWCFIRWLEEHRLVS